MSRSAKARDRGESGAQAIASDPGRRSLVRRVAGAGALVLPSWVEGQPRDPRRAIEQVARPGPVEFAARAEQMRRAAIEQGDQPYGAVVVRDGRIVGEGVSAVLTTPDPTAHAEMQAIRDAALRLGSADLSGCTLYGTARACPMCEAGAYWARIARMFHGPRADDAGPPRLR